MFLIIFHKNRIFRNIPLQIVGKSAKINITEFSSAINHQYEIRSHPEKVNGFLGEGTIRGAGCFIRIER